MGAGDKWLRHSNVILPPGAVASGFFVDYGRMTMRVSGVVDTSEGPLGWIGVG